MAGQCCLGHALPDLPVHALCQCCRPCCKAAFVQNGLKCSHCSHSLGQPLSAAAAAAGATTLPAAPQPAAGTKRQTSSSPVASGLKLFSPQHARQRQLAPPGVLNAAMGAGWPMLAAPAGASAWMPGGAQASQLTAVPVMPPEDFAAAMGEVTTDQFAELMAQIAANQQQQGQQQGRGQQPLWPLPGPPTYEQEEVVQSTPAYTRAQRSALPNCS